jgi:hypothetical protein
MKDLHQTLTIDNETGEFEPQGRFVALDIVDQIDLLEDWQYDLGQYRVHLLVLLYLEQEQKGENWMTKSEAATTFRKTAAIMGLQIPDDFESFVEAHRHLTSVPRKPRTCPVCNSDD